MDPRCLGRSRGERGGPYREIMRAARPQSSGFRQTRPRERRLRLEPLGAHLQRGVREPKELRVAALNVASRLALPGLGDLKTRSSLLPRTCPPKIARPHTATDASWPRKDTRSLPRWWASFCTGWATVFPPLTASKKEIIEDSVHPLRTYVIECVESGHFANTIKTLFTFDELQCQLTRDGYGPQARNTRELGEALKAAGVTSSRPTIEGKKVRMYTLPHQGVREPGPF